METNLNFEDRVKAELDRNGSEVLSKRTLANRRNAQKSTGPRTAEGKASSRRNAVKTGLTGAGTVLPADMEEERRENVEAWHRSYGPKDEAEAQLIEVAASTMVRLRRCWREESLARARAVDRAELGWDLDREAELVKLTKSFRDDPTSVVPALRRTLHGARWLLERWTLLRLKLDTGRPWTDDQRRLALDLLALPEEFRDDFSPFDPPPPADPIDARRAIADREIARLNAEIEGALAPLDEDERALRVGDIMIAADGEVARLQGYESRLNGRLARSMSQIRQSRRDQPEPKPKKAPAPVARTEPAAPPPAPIPVPVVTDPAPTPAVEPAPPPPAPLPLHLPPELDRDASEFQKHKLVILMAMADQHQQTGSVAGWESRYEKTLAEVTARSAQSPEPKPQE